MRILIFYILLCYPLWMNAQNCNGNLNVTITGSSTGDTILVNYSTVDIYCPDQNDGSIDLDITGGNPEYDFLWSNDSSDEDQYFLEAGSYTITITDNEDCQAIEEIEIVVMDPVDHNLNLVDEDACGNCTLSDNDATYFYYQDMFIANIEDLSDGSNLGYTSICSQLFNAISYCEGDPCLPRNWTVETGDAAAQLSLYFSDDEFQDLIDASDCNSIAECIANGDLCISGYSGGKQNCDDFVSKYSYSLADGDFTITEGDPVDGIWSISFVINNSLISSPQNGPTTYFLHTCKSNGNPLPLDLISFKANAADRTNILHWKTINEIEFSHFDIQRSKDGTNFNSIGIQNSLIGSNPEKLYDFEDTLPLSGYNYYRLKMIDLNGAFTYSHIVLVNRFDEHLLNVFPNPFIEKLNINLETKTKKLINLFIYNNQNQLIYKQAFQFDAQDSKQTIDLEYIQSGIYHLIILDEATRRVISKDKIVKFKN